MNKINIEHTWQRKWKVRTRYSCRPTSYFSPIYSMPAIKRETTIQVLQYIPRCNDWWYFSSQCFSQRMHEEGFTWGIICGGNQTSCSRQIQKCNKMTATIEHFSDKRNFDAFVTDNLPHVRPVEYALGQSKERNNAVHVYTNHTDTACIIHKGGCTRSSAEYPYVMRFKIERFLWWILFWESPIVEWRKQIAAYTVLLRLYHNETRIA